MTEPKIITATPAHRDRVVESLVAAFANDPILRFLFPDDTTYPPYAAAFFGHLFDKRVPKETVWTVADGASVAIWEPPGADSGDDPHDSWTSTLPADVTARIRAYNDALHKALPTTPFWYLGVLGTHPDHAGHRWGHAVMSAGLQRAAADGLPAVLETSNPANIEIYRRAGWQIIDEMTDPLPTWIMQQPTTTPH